MNVDIWTCMNKTKKELFAFFFAFGPDDKDCSLYK